jgi:predicted ArsR family transcriptional regulator
MIGLFRRGRQTITSLAGALGLTDNAIRTHVTLLARDGIVEHAGVERDTGGKPARVYALTREGEELFPKAYALILERLLAELARRDGRERTMRLLRTVGTKAAAESGAVAPRDLKGRAEAAAGVLRSLGGAIEVQKVDKAWELQGCGCPLSAVTANHAELCGVVKAIVEEVTQETVVECCDRAGDRPRCRFRIEAA